MSTIPLSKSYAPDKLVFPVALSEKYDGVPIVLTLRVDSAGVPAEYTLRTRQDEPVISAHLVIDEWLVQNLSFFEGFVGIHKVVGEIVQTKDFRAPFKDTSGIVRRQTCAGYDLTWGIFDYFWNGDDESYIDRFTHFTDKTQPTSNVHVIPFSICKNQAELDKIYDGFTMLHPKAEGMVARSATDTFNPGKRSWGYQKMLNEPTIDLFIVGFEEAVDKYKEPKGMVGRVIAEYHGDKIGVGPGKLSHAERKELWEEWVHWQSAIRSGYKDTPWKRLAQIKYKKDDSYDALRQPTFQHWRDDKSTADA